MARSSATAVFLLLLSLLAVARCGALESKPGLDASTDEITTVEETGPANPTVIPTPEAVPTEEEEAVVPAEQQQVTFLRLPSHRRHRHHPCRHGGLFHRHHGSVFFRQQPVAEPDPDRSHELREVSGAEAEKVNPVAEPDPDSSLPYSHGGDDAAAVKRWSMFRHGPRHHHHHHHEDGDEDHEQEEEKGRSAGVMKRFRHLDDDEEEEEKEKKMKKLFRHLHHRHHEDEKEKVRNPFHHADDDSDDDLEEIVRRFRKAILKRRFRFHHHGRRFFRRHHHDEQDQEGGVITWIKGLFNRF